MGRGQSWGLRFSSRTRLLKAARVAGLPEPLKLACPMFCTIDKCKGIVKGKILLPVVMNNASWRRFGDRSLKRDIIESSSVERVPSTIDTARTSAHDSSIRTPGLCWVRERLLSGTVWLAPTMVQIRLLSMERL